FRLSWDGGEVRRSGLAEPRYLMRPPGRLAAGRAYRFEAQGLGADGRPMGAPVAGAFTVAEAPPELRGVEAAARLELEPSEGAFVLAGWFAEFGSPSDVAAALAEAVRGGAGAPEALDVLAALGCR
ncbi:MAG TPA: hypothetical protein VD813_01240, partial [Pseudonocardia sp.]|nr:hypothetical protein [Pseudonocardia sp.]